MAAKTLLAESQKIDEGTADIAEQYLQPVLNLLALVTDSGFLRFCQIPSHIQTSSAGDQALIGSVLPGQIIAIPTALASQEFTVTRCWILEQEDMVATGALKIVDKYYLLGCRTLVADGTVICRKDKQRVY
jgi:hypothetical protein